MITSDRRPARTRNTTIIVVLGPINAVAATPWVDFRVGEPIRTPPIRGRLGRMSERGPAPVPRDNQGENLIQIVGVPQRLPKGEMIMN